MENTDKYRKFTGEKIASVGDYVVDYVNSHEDIEIMVGTDSQNRGDFTVYSTVIALYTPGHGAHCIFRRWREKRERVRSVRLMNEVWASVECAEYLKSLGVECIKYIDLDINPSPRFKSNEVFTSARGMVEGLGYEVRFKTFGPLVTTLADYVVKH
jgi:predicted RNase H-related nuclease YkuK (DUF458 family)